MVGALFNNRSSPVMPTMKWSRGGPRLRKSGDPNTDQGKRLRRRDV
jgi:hypothetical protein